MNSATQVYSHEFDADFLKIPLELRSRIQAKIDGLGSRLSFYPHPRLTGLGCYRDRIGYYRVIYDFDPVKGVIQLLAFGHRRDVYRG